MRDFWNIRAIKNLLLAAALVVGLAAPVLGAVVLDTVGTELSGTGLTSFSAGNENTVGTGTNRALVVMLVFSNKSVSGVAVTWDSGGTNQAMTLIGTANATGTNGRVELWGLVNPTSGTLALAGSWTGTSDVMVVGVSWTGVNQAGGATSFPHFTSANGTNSAPTLTITSAVGNATMAVGASTVENFTTPGQTQVFQDNLGATTNGEGSRAAGAATVTHALNTTPTGLTSWVEVGTDIQASGGTVTPCTISLLGVGRC